jgi:hypothetical protein
MVRRRIEELESGRTGGFGGAQIVWERERAVEKELRLAAEYTKQRWVERFPDFPVETEWVQLNDSVNWPCRVHGIVLADFGRSSDEISRSYDQAMTRCDGRVPIIVFAVNRAPKPRVPKPPSIFFKVGSETPRVSIQTQEQEFELFLERAYSIAAAQAA